MNKKLCVVMLAFVPANHVDKHEMNFQHIRINQNYGQWTCMYNINQRKKNINLISSCSSSLVCQYCVTTDKRFHIFLIQKASESDARHGNCISKLDTPGDTYYFFCGYNKLRTLCPVWSSPSKMSIMCVVFVWESIFAVLCS